MDFFWGQRKSLVYEMPVPSVEGFIARISLAGERICEMPRIFQNEEMPCSAAVRPSRTFSRNFEICGTTFQ
ncbi:hypothetical protein TNCV_1592311 [Trichonephila clavipes]|nr:hypothetical protein TNCV_1592311 [Trichonephila clavipes]